MSDKNLVKRSVSLAFKNRPRHPRRVSVSNNVLSWEPPKDDSNVTHYRVYQDQDDSGSLVREIPSGQHTMADGLTADRVFVSAYNSITGLESPRVVSDGPLSAGDLTIRIAYAD